MSTWDDLASSERWRGVVGFIRNWVGPFDASCGMTAEEFVGLLSEELPQLPVAVREWYLLAGKWSQGGLGVWIPPDQLELEGGVMVILGDIHGVTEWCIRATDMHFEDPPVVMESGEVVCSRFSDFVAFMVVNDCLFGDEVTEEPVDLNPNSTRTILTYLFPTPIGDLLTDAPFESTTTIAFVYPNNGPTCGKSRTPEGRALLNRLK